MGKRAPVADKLTPVAPDFPSCKLRRESHKGRKVSGRESPPVKALKFRNLGRQVVKIKSCKQSIPLKKTQKRDAMSLSSEALAAAGETCVFVLPKNECA